MSGAQEARVATERPMSHRQTNLTMIIGLTIFFFFAVVSLLAPLIAPYDPNVQDLGKALRPPFWDARGSFEHILGTDKFGRDFLSRLIYGGRVSFLVAGVTVVISGVIGITLGLVGGFYGGRRETAVLFLINVRLSMPIILVAIAAVTVLGSSLLTISSVLGLLLWDRFATVVRSAVRQQRALGYVLAARAFGASDLHIMVREILPNVAGAIVVIAALEMSLAIFLESALSFLGVGVQPPTSSWGLMIAEGKDYMFIHPYLIAIPGAVIFLMIISINLIADDLRDRDKMKGDR